MAGALAGCGPGEVEVTVDRQSVAPGDCIGLVVENSGTFDEVVVEHCGPVLERYNGDDYGNPVIALADPCLGWTMAIGGFSRSKFSAQIPADSSGGIYAFILKVAWPAQGRSGQVGSNAFDVAGAPQGLDARCDFSGPVAPDG